jgi:hypothetical protein
LNGAALVLGLLAVSAAACGSTTSKATGGTDAGPDVAVTTQSQEVVCPASANIVKDGDCDKDQRPFVFVHGTYGFGANFAHVAALLGSNGFCQDRIVGVEYNSLGEQPGAKCTGTNTPSGCGKIDAVVNAVLATAKDSKGMAFTQVDIAGHSQGTAHCGTYLSDPAQAAKIAHYFNFSGSPQTNNVPTLSLSSQHDLGGSPHHAMGTLCTTNAMGDTPGAPAGCNLSEVTFVHQDHFAVAASLDSFKEVYKYLKGKDPQYTEIQCGEDPVTVEGISERFADNVPNLGMIEVRETGETPQALGTLTKTLMPDATGHFGPFTVKRGVPYEFTGYDATGKLIGYQYYSPFKRSDRLVRLIGPADDGSALGTTIANQSTNKIVRSSKYTAVIALWAGGAFRQDLGASLTVDEPMSGFPSGGSDVLTDGNAGAGAFSASQSLNGGVVGFYMFDKNGNGKTDLGLVDSSAFQAYTDVFLDAATPQFIDFTFTAGLEEPATVGHKLRISNWPSDKALIQIVIQ